MKMRTLRNLCALFVCILIGTASQAQLSGTYTIDPNGSGTNNYTTVSSAVSALESNGVSGPVTFNIAPGTYTERISIDEITGASSTNTITFDGTHTDSVTIRNSGSSQSASATWQFNGADHIHLKNMTLYAYGSYRVNLHFVNGADSNMVDNLVLDMPSHTSSNYRNILFASSSWGTGDHGDDNVIKNTNIDGGRYGVYMYSNSSNSNDNNIFENCVWNDVYYYGVYDYYGDGNEFHSCEITTSYVYGYPFYSNRNSNVLMDSCTIDEGRYAVYDYYGEDNTYKNSTFQDQRSYNVYAYRSDGVVFDNVLMDNPNSYNMRMYYARNCEVKNCTLQDPGSYNIYGWYATNNTYHGNTIEGGSNTYYNMYLYRCGSDSISSNFIYDARRSHVYGYYSSSSSFINNIVGPGLSQQYSYEHALWIYRSSNWKIWHNTIYTDAGGGASSSNFPYYYPSCLFNYYSSSLDVRNNIFEYAGSQSNGVCVSMYGGSFSNLDYNNYQSTQKMCNWSYTEYNDLSSWQKGLTNFNQNSYEETNYYLDLANDDFHLSALQPGLDGEALGIETDIDGDQRCNFSQTVGADESSYPVRKPTANFVVDDTVYVNSPTTILNSNGGINGQHFWYVDGNFINNADHLNYTFTSRGSYTISLVTANCGGIDSIAKTVVADTSTLAPDGDFIVNKSVSDVFEKVELTDLSTNGPTDWEYIISPDSIFDPLFFGTVPRYTWTDGTNQNSRNPVLTFDYPGKYTITMVVSNGAGSDTVVKQDVVLVRATQNMCIFPDNTDIEQGTLFDEGGPTGQYSNNQNCSFLIDPCADEVYLDFKSFNLASGDYLRIYDGRDNSGDPLWDVNAYGNNGISGSMTNSAFDTIYTAESGVMFIEFVSNGSGTADGFEAQWSIKKGTFVAPSADFDLPDSVCVGHSADFENLSSGDVQLYTWRFGVNAFSFSNDEDASYTYLTAGTYTVTLTAEGCAGVDSMRKSIVAYVINKKPSGDFDADITRPTSADVVTFTPKTENCVDKYKWTVSPSSGVSFANGTTDSSMMPQMYFQNTGKYTVSMEVINAATSDTLTKQDYIEVIDYCTPSVALLSEDLGISNVYLDGTPELDNSSDAGRRGYNDFTNVSTRIEKGADYTVSVTRPSNNNKARRAIWIDWNQDGDFSSAELIGQENTGTSALSYTVNFTVPGTARVGGTRMRVASNVGSRTNTACGPNLYGEFEDYRIIVSEDETLPVVTLKGDETTYVNQCETYVDSGATACDNIGGCGFTVTTQGLPINTSVADTFEIVYTTTDSAGNVSMPVTRTVIVRADTETPQISLNGSDMDIHVFSSYNELGATATDSCGTQAIIITSNVDTANVGSYLVTYSVEDNNGNQSVAERVVNVVDTVKPTLTLRGTDTAYVDVFASYTDSGATFSDNYYTGITPSGYTNLDVNTLGEYYYRWEAADGSGNLADPVERVVIVEDNVAPEVSLLGDDTVILDLGNRIYDLFAVAQDNYDGEMIKPTLGGTFYSTFPNGVADQVGEFEATYSFTDNSGNTASATRTVQVVDRIAPQISLKGGHVLTVCRWADYTDAGVSASDNSGSYTLDTNSTVDVQSEGTYYISYTAMDASGNESQVVTRIVTVEQCGVGYDEVIGGNLEIYPNPTTGQFTLDVKLQETQQVKITVMNVLGEEIQTVHNGMMKEDFFTVNLSDRASGIYLVEIQAGDRSVIKRVNVNR